MLLFSESSITIFLEESELISLKISLLLTFNIFVSEKLGLYQNVILNLCNVPLFDTVSSSLLMENECSILLFIYFTFFGIDNKCT